jgi:hypothetical protein
MNGWPGKHEAFRNGNAPLGSVDGYGWR